MLLASVLFVEGLGLREPEAVATQEKLARDIDDNCAVWAEHDECEKNRDFMRANCAESCARCAGFVFALEWSL